MNNFKFKVKNHVYENMESKNVDIGKSKCNISINNNEIQVDGFINGGYNPDKLNNINNIEIANLQETTYTLPEFVDYQANNDLSDNVFNLNDNVDLSGNSMIDLSGNVISI